MHPEDIGTLLRTSAEGGRAELRLGRRDGTYVWVSLRNSVVADAADGPRFLLTHVEDIEERKRHELQLAHRASHDSLTGLPNSAELRSRLGARLCRRPQSVRATAVEALDAAFETRPEAGGAGEHGFRPDGHDGSDYGFPAPGVGAGAAGAGAVPGSGAAPGTDPFDFSGAFTSHADGPYDHHVHIVAPATDVDDGTKGLAVLFCDLDGFKSINDRFGHHTGDAVLIEVARRLTTCVRDGDTVARLGGDEFVVLADGLGAADAADLAVRLRNAIIPPIRVDGRAVRVGASFGIGWASCGMSADEVLRSADQRMYIEKRSRSKAHRRAG